MKQLHTVAAVLLLFPNLGLTQHRFFEFSFHIQAEDLANTPGGLVDMGIAFLFIDEICGQVPDEAPADLPVSGAYNMDTGDFMIWDDYMRTVGLAGNPQFNWATGPWHTFKGRCSLKPVSAWIENSVTSYGNWVYNAVARGSRSRKSRINIHLVGFTTVTVVPSWRSRCDNVDEMAQMFGAMPEIPDLLKGLWKGLELRVQRNEVIRKSIQVPFRHEGQAVATTNVLVVEAQLVLKVERWYWYYEPVMSGVSTGWQGMGGLWHYVYADLAWVQARGLAQQRPVNPNRGRKPDWWYCVNMGHENNNIRPRNP
jgi:hypothetical protein